MSNGWFADLDRENGMYQPVLNTNSSWCPSIAVWFLTAKECEEFIRDYLIGTGWDEDEPTEIEKGKT